MQPCLAISYLPVPGGRVDEDEEVLDVLVGERAAEQQLVQDLDERHEEVLVAAPDRVAVVQLVHLVGRRLPMVRMGCYGSFIYITFANFMGILILSHMGSNTIYATSATMTAF